MVRLRLIQYDILQGINVSPVRTPAYPAHVSDEKSLQVYSEPASAVEYKDKIKLIRIKRKSKYLQSPYIDYCQVDRIRNEVEKEYDAFKKDNQRRYVAWFCITYSYFNFNKISIYFYAVGMSD